MAVWKKVIVSGSDAHLNQITSSILTDTNLLIAGAGGAIGNSGITVSGNVLDVGANSITSTGANSIITGSFTGSFTGDGSGLTGVTAETLPNNLVDGNGIADFTFNGSAGASVAVEVSGSTLTVGASGVAVNAGGITTVELANDSVTADKLDDVFTDGGGVAGTFGSATSVPVVTIDGQGRITTASLANISTTLSIDGDSGSDTVSLITDTLSFNGGNAISVAVTDNTVTINGASGIISSSAEGDAQGQIKLNGVNVDANALGTGDSPTFASLTTTGNITVQGDLLVTGDTIQAQVTNLNVEDRYILLNSGSTTGDSGIIFGGADGEANKGVGLVWDFSYNSNDGRLSIVNSLHATGSGVVTPSYAIAGVFEGTENDAATAQADHAGNIRIESGEIYIYV